MLERPYLAARSGLRDTWFAMRSMRPASSAGKIASHCVSTNSSRQPAFAAIALTTSMS
ncbi:hypothetical protein SAMN04488564_111255 [Lentzea waywayandensis]|uniref:Uncharacterized protein n=1 Tax=Lentzea waywayandensis TaxID=84724 RepID=A0A1I6FD42_9PSEU|nr:hypothetical protein SAMN04488564_111255 [Lentzea waywayandensis]